MLYTKYQILDTDLYPPFGFEAVSGGFALGFLLGISFPFGDQFFTKIDAHDEMFVMIRPPLFHYAI